MESDQLPSFRLDGQVALVTGASRGIGRGLVEALAAAGATVAATARSLADAASVADAVVAAGGSSTAHALDVTSLRSIDAAVDAVVAQHSRLDVLIANAGVGDNLPAIDVSEEHWDSMMDVNLKGLFFTAKACAAPMIKQGSGRVIAISSQASLVGIRDHVAYSATKGGVNQMVRVLALEWGRSASRSTRWRPPSSIPRGPPSASTIPSTSRPLSTGSPSVTSVRSRTLPGPSSTWRRRREPW